MFAPLIFFVLILIILLIFYLFLYNYSWIRGILGSDEISPDFVDKYTNCEYDISKFGLNDYKALFPITSAEAQAEVLEINLKSNFKEMQKQKKRENSSLVISTN